MKLFALLAICLTCVCVADAAPAKWTVMVYMTGVDNLEKRAIDDLFEMKRVPLSKDVNVVVQLKREGKRINGIKFWKGALRHRIGDTLDVDKAFPANMADKSTLKSFIAWAKETYPAERYALVVWCHGEGWRRVQLAPNRWLLAPSGVSDAPFKSCSADGNDVLMNAEAAEAIAEAMGCVKLDVLAFDSCLMQMIETAYAFRNVATMLVGSEELVPEYGFRYDKWLARLVKAPGSNAGALADIVVDEYRENYSVNATTTLSALDLTKMPQLSSAISAFADALRSALAADAARIAGARKECDIYAPKGCADGTCVEGVFNHIDLHRFADRVSTNMPGTPAGTAAAALAKAIDDAVRDHPWAGSKRDPSTRFGSFGLAVYFPIDGKTYIEDEWNDHSYDKPQTNKFLPYPVAFVADQTWADFLHAYFAAVPEVWQ